MTNFSRFMAVQPSSAYQSSEVSDNGELFGTPETKSERSRYYDAESDGGALSTSASEVDAFDEAPPVLPNGAASPLSGAGSLRSSGQQRQLPEASPAVLLGKVHELQSQRDEMNRKLFNLQRSHDTLQQDNVSLTSQNSTLQQQNVQLREQLVSVQQEHQELQDQMVVARTAESLMGRVIGADLAASALKAENATLRHSLDFLRHKRKLEEEARLAKIARDNSWSGMMRSVASSVALVAMGAASIIVLDAVVQANDTRRILMRPE